MKKPLRCRFGFHRNVVGHTLITTGHDVCLDCGTAWMTSLFGDFTLPKDRALEVYNEAVERIGNGKTGGQTAP